MKILYTTKVPEPDYKYGYAVPLVDSKTSNLISCGHGRIKDHVYMIRGMDAARVQLFNIGEKADLKGWLAIDDVRPATHQEIQEYLKQRKT